MDTIVAPASAAGFGDRALVRLSGPDAQAIVAQLLEVTTPPRAGHTGAALWHIEPGLSLPLMLLGFVAPRSYTGEDVVEVHLPGWPPLVSELVRRAVDCGARPAARGEFTRRALANGRLDLAQAAAVGRLSLAGSPEEAQAAAAVLTGERAAGQQRLADALLDALTLIEAHIDFEDEDTEAVSEQQLRAALTGARRACDALSSQADAAPSADGETDVALLGPPNAGKSSLLLALCPGATTSVSPQAGTTRDMLEARVQRGGRSYRLLDGPGIEAASGPAGAGPAEPGALDDLDRRAMDLFLAVLPRGAVVLHVDDGAHPAPPEGRAALRAVVPDRAVVSVWNKCDLLGPEASPPDASPPVCHVSALQGSGLEALWQALADAAPAPRAPDLAGTLQRAALTEARARIDEALAQDLSGALPLAALALREALVALDQPDPTGADITEAVLDRVFASFCLGK